MLVKRILLSAGLAAFLMALALKALVPGASAMETLASGDGVDFGPATLFLRSFTIQKYASGKPSQFVSDVRVVAPGDDKMTCARISVNSPLRWRGWWIHQIGYDAHDGRSTTLAFSRDPWLPLAVIAGMLVILGALCNLSHPRIEPFNPSSCWSWFAAAVSALLPMFIIGRAILRPEPPPALQSPFMVPHVACYAASYLIALFAAFGVMRRLLPLGFLLMTLGLVLGATWGKICWGDFWQYDPKELWSLATWLVYAVHSCLNDGSVRAERTFRWLGAVLVVLTLTWVNFSRLFAGLHNYA